MLKLDVNENRHLNWITPTEFSELVSITKRGAQKVFTKALQGKKWRNQTLVIKTVEGRGGKAGINYLLDVHSLSPDWLEKWYQANGKKAVVHQTTVQSDEPIDKPIKSKPICKVQNSKAIGKPKNGKDTQEVTNNRILGDRDWLTAEQFFNLVGKWKHIRNAQLVLKDALLGKPWNGHQLKVIEVEGVGRGGKVLKVHAKSLPDEYQKKWEYLYNRDHFVIPTENGGAIDSIDLKDNASWFMSLSPTQKEMIMFKYNMIKDFLDLPSGTALKPIIEKKVQETVYCPNGKNKVGFNSFYRWVKQYQKEGLPGLARQGRNDAGVKRVLVSKSFDDFAAKKLTEQQHITIQSQVEDLIISEWAEGLSKGTDILKLATEELQNSVSLILQRPLTQREKEICVASEDKVKKMRTPHAYAAGVKKTDNQRYRNDILPRLAKRTRDGILPNDVWIGDEHPMDIQCMRKDGSIIHARLIGWLDLATNRMYATLVFLPKGKDIRRLDIARSFCNAVKQNGLPKLLYLDNGQPYKWKSMLEGFTTLSNQANKANKGFKVELVDSEVFIQVQKFIQDRLDREGDNVIRAKPYNPQAKPIEGIFGRLEQNYFSKIKGWIGGDRLNKKVQKVGKTPDSFSGTLEEFEIEIENKLALYHRTIQREDGALNGCSPAQKLEEFIKRGWRATEVEEETLLLSFSEKYDKKGNELTRVITSGGMLQYAVKGLGTIYYRSDKLMSYVIKGLSLKIMVPMHDPRIVFVKTPEGNIVVAKKVINYNFLDPAGIAEQNRMEKVLNAQLATIKRNCSFINNNQITENALEVSEPEPEIPFDLSISIETEETKSMTEALKQIEHQEIENTASTIEAEALWLDD